VSEDDDNDNEATSGTLVPTMDGDLINLHEDSPDEPEMSKYTLAQLDELGLPAPLASPEVMRGLYAYRRKIVASMLDREHDFLYTISYEEQGKKRDKLTTSYAEAIKYANTYKVPYKATPKKSGIAKLATAFGVEEKLIQQLGLPVEPTANYAYAKYEVTAKKSGKKAIGVGFARINERGFPMPEHHMIALADTRAWGRAVLRLAGFGEAGAEEIDGEVMPVQTIRIVQGDPAPAKKLSESAQAEVLTVEKAPEPTRVPVQQAAPAAAQQAAPQTVAAAQGIPMPSITTITEAQVGKLSSLLKAKLGSKDRAVAWLTAEAHVSTTRQVPESMYANLVKKLEAIQEAQ